jgi:DNA-binding NarL/FixJ family response regulator
MKMNSKMTNQLLNERKTILLVDDHTLFREGLKGLLKESRNFDVVAEAGTVNDALAIALKLTPDLVLMDIAMVDINGIEGTQLLLEKIPGLKVIVISMYSKMDYIIGALQAGASGYLVKDTTPDKLLNALDTVARGSYYFDHRSLGEIVNFVLEQKDRRPFLSEENYDRLTRREQEIMRLVAQGLSSKDIGAKLFISPKTVDNHRTKIMEKLEMDSVVDLVKYAAKLGIIKIH